MKLSSKHANEQTITLSDFSGGLNTSATEEMIGQNQLSEMVNMEIDPSVGLLQTVRGTDDLYKLPVDAAYKFKSAAYDILNKTMIIFSDDGQIFATQDFNMLKQVGTLTGTNEVVTALWEDGLLIASGGKLQYAIGSKNISIISTSPANCNGVYIRSGRVLTFDNEDNVLYSGVGDETDWTQESNDPSSSLFAQIGYKVGGHIIGMVNMSKDILFIKSNGMIFRLENEYPDWNISELGRNVFCRGNAAYCNIGDNVVILGNGILQIIQTTQEYGDMKPANIGIHVKIEISSLPPSTKLRYVPSLNQLWCIANNNYVLIYDCNNRAFYQRYFNSDVVDVVSVDHEIYVIKKDAICKLAEVGFYDNGLPLVCRARFKSNLSLNESLIKKVAVCITPFESFYDKSNTYFNLGKITVPFPGRTESVNGEERYTVKINASATMVGSSYVDGNNEDVFLNGEYITPSESILIKSKVVYRSSRIRTSIHGSGFPFILNFFSYDSVEV